MESEEGILQTFRALGVRGNAAKAYLTLLRIGPSTATRISQFSGVPQPRTYDIMDYLQQLGFIEVQKIGRRNIYRASKPEFALDRLMSNLGSKASFLRDHLSKLERTEEGLLSPEIWLIKGQKNIMARICEIIEKSEVDLLLAVSPHLLSKQLLSCLRDAAHRGVSSSIIVYSLSNIPARMLEMLKELASIRQRRVFYTTMAMADYKYGLILSHIKRDSGSEYAVYTEDPGLLHILDYHFYFWLWVPSERLTEEEPMTKSFTHIWRAIETAKFHMKEGREVRATIRGREVKTGKETSIEGVVCGTTCKHPRRSGIPVYSLILRNADNEIVKVGGRGAMIEDVEALRITLEV